MATRLSAATARNTGKGFFSLSLNAQELYPVAWPIARNGNYAVFPAKRRRAPYAIIVHQLDRRRRFCATQKNLAFLIVIEILQHDNIRSIISAAMKRENILGINADIVHRSSAKSIKYIINKTLTRLGIQVSHAQFEMIRHYRDFSA